MFSSEQAQAHKPVAIVTGGASGIGLAISQHFAFLDYITVVFDIDQRHPVDIVDLVRKETPFSRVYVHRCSVSSWDDLAEGFKLVYKRFGTIDIVVANAGIAEVVPSEMSKVQDEPVKPDLKVMDVNLNGVIYTVRLASYYMSKNAVSEDRHRGSIICTASMAGLYPFPLSPLYTMSKFGVVGLVRAMGPVLAKHNISINALAPAVLDTNIMTNKTILEGMRVTPTSTIVQGITKFLESNELTGEVLEIHGENTTLRPPHEVIDEHERKNLAEFWRIGQGLS